MDVTSCQNCRWAALGAAVLCMQRYGQFYQSGSARHGRRIGPPSEVLSSTGEIDDYFYRYGLCAVSGTLHGQRIDWVSF